MSNWQLPEGIDELTGKQANAFESARRELLDLYQGWGYEIVIPPMIEYADNLVLNSKSIDDKTFKFLDSASSRMLGVHSDITPQVARIDSKKSNPEEINRYCYINAILQTKADDFYASRSPIQAGVELYGFKGVDADKEVIVLMLSSLNILGISSPTLSLGNTAIFNELCKFSELKDNDKSILRDIFRRKSIPDLDDFLSQNEIKEGNKFKSLISLDGDEKILNIALDIFKDMPLIIEAIKDLQQLNEVFKNDDTKLTFDLGEVKAYEYHDGIVFAAYTDKFSKAIAQGGRYDGLSQLFDSSREATGFSFDLKFLILQQSLGLKNKKILNAPNINNPDFLDLVNDLRDQGYIVRVDLNGSKDLDFVNKNGKWKVKN